MNFDSINVFPYFGGWPEDERDFPTGTGGEDADSAALAFRRPTDSVAPDADEGKTPSLSHFYRDWFRPVYLTRRKVCDKTVLLYDQSVAHWVRLTGDPPLDVIDEERADDFMFRLSQLPGRRDATLSPHTVRKHGRNLQTILLRAGPKVRGVRGCRAIIDEVPSFDLPKTSRIAARGKDFSADELRAILAATPCMNTPQKAVCDCDPPAWWRALVLMGYHTGIRIGALMAVEWEHLRDGWIDVPDEISKGGRGIRVPVHADALAAIARLPHRSGVILRWPNVARWGICNLRQRWNRLLRNAGIDRDRRFGFHSLRKSCCNALMRVEPIAAKLMLGHATDVTERHYTNRDDLLSAAVAKMERIVDEET